LKFEKVISNEGGTCVTGLIIKIWKSISLRDLKFY